jgi:hypothetical protein
MAGYSICLIGNSHLAALAPAWRKDRFGARPEVSPVYFGKRAGHDWELAVRDGALIPTDEDGQEAFQRSSGGHRSIVIGDYDAFVIYGLGFQVSKAWPLFFEYGSVEDLHWGPVNQLISQDCFAAALRSAISGATALKVLAQIRSVCATPAIICPMPFRSESAFPQSSLGRHPRLSQPGYLARVAEEFHHACRAVCAKRGGEFIAQPESTWAMPCFTRSEFVLGGSTWRRDEKGETKRKGDDKHMNDRYGALMLQAILPRLDELSGGAVLEKESQAAPAEARLEAAE